MAWSKTILAMRPFAKDGDSSASLREQGLGWSVDVDKHPGESFNERINV